MTVLRRRVAIAVPDGVHARPVAELVRLAQAHSAPVTLSTDAGERVDLTSILALMDLGLLPGDEVTLEVADAPGAAVLLDSLVAVIAPR
ncbi:HPr family phosphocarrier protein [Microbacterium sp. NPDC058345]|uniref:HPr family phosphocarrier protein n=1 Tax=Microbacterium sp. NPDC058345 TaxID=3346455 RepID=UPI00365D2CF9